jgi:hypothetical protein
VPLTGDLAGLRRLRRSVEGLARPDGAGRAELAGQVQGEVKALIAEEFTRGVAPDGSTWAPTKRGKPALISRKLPNAFASRIDRGVVRFIAKSTRDLLVAHQHGHVFPARQVGEHKQYLSFNSKGKLVAERRIFKKDGTVRRGASQRYAAAHTVRERVLAARQIYPEGTMPLRWQEAIARGLTSGMTRWAAAAEK